MIWIIVSAFCFKTNLGYNYDCVTMLNDTHHYKTRKECAKYESKYKACVPALKTWEYKS